MSYPKRLLRLSPRRGIATDTPPWELGPDLWSQGNNVVFRNAFAERAPSTLKVYDPPLTPIYSLLNAQIGGVNYWIYHGANSSTAVETTNHTDITHAAGLQAAAANHLWTAGLLNGVPFANNGLDEPMYWAGDVGAPFATLPGWPAGTVCGALLAHRFHLFALDISGPAGDFPNEVMWSDKAEPGTVPSSWTAAADNEAGSAFLSDTPGPVITGGNLRGSLMLYKTGSTHLADYIGPDEIFQFRTLFVQSGILARHCFVDINGRHFVVTDGDIIVTDGVNIQSVAQARRRRFLFNQLDQNNFRNVFVVYHRAKNEVWVCFPEAGSSLCTRAMIWDIANDAWGDRELPGIATAATGIINDTAPDESWDADSEPWDSDLTEWNLQNFSLATEALVLADPITPALREVGRGSESLTSVIAKHGLTFGEPERYKFAKRVHVRIDADPSIAFTLRVGSQESADGAVTWGDPVTITSADQFANVLAMGRYLSVELTTSSEATWAVTGLDIEAELRGYH